MGPKDWAAQIAVIVGTVLVAVLAAPKSGGGGDGGTDWVIPLLSAAAGALVGGLVVWAIGRSTRVRGGRVELYRSYLRPFHDSVNDKCSAVVDRDLVGGVDGATSLQFQNLDAEAAVTSGRDLRWARPIWGRLDAIDQVMLAYNTRGNMPNDEAAAIVAATLPQLKELWPELNCYLWSYRFWLEWQFTRGIWNAWPPAYARRWFAVAHGEGHCACTEAANPDRRR